MEAARLPDALDPLLAALESAEGTGVVTAVRSSVQKRIAIERGNVIFAASDDPRDLIGQALLRARLITEKDLVDALAADAPAGAQPGLPRLAAALTAMKRVTPEQCAAVFEAKIRESVLDVFLWDSGAVVFEEGGMTAAHAFPLTIPLAGLRIEGARRRSRWTVVQRILPDSEIAFERAGDAWPVGFPASAGDQRLVEFVEKGLTLGRVLAELRGQDYAVSVRLAALVQQGILRTVRPSGFVPVEVEVDVDLSLLDGPSPGAVSEVPSGEFTKAGRLPVAAAPAPPPGAPDPSVLLELARERFAEGNVDDAYLLIMECVAADPMAAMEGWEILQQVEQALVDRARANGIHDGLKLGLARSITVQIGKPLAPTEAFVMSRFASGAMTVGSLLAICPFQPHEVLVLLERWLADGTLAKR